MRLSYVPVCSLRLAIRVVSILAVFAGMAFAQSTVSTGSITGIVTDPSGSAASDVEVLIKNVDVGPQISVMTSVAGLYSSGPILPGNYVVHLEVRGFVDIDFPVRVKVGMASNGDVRLQPNLAGKNKTTPSPTELDIERSSVSGVVTSEQLDTLPLNGRNFLDLAQLEPGIQVFDGADIDATKSGFFAVSVEGQSGRTTRTLLDEIDISDERAGSSTQNLSPSSIQEFQVAQSVLDLSSSMTSSGTLNAVTRTGTNDYHGSGFYGFRDQRLGFAAFPGGRDSYFQRNQFGGNIGGAIIRNKLFFFVSAERTKQDYRSAPALDNPFNGLFAPYNTPFRDNPILARIDWVGVNKRLFYRGTYDENSDLGGANNFSPFLAHNIGTSHAIGADFYQGKITHSIRAGYSRYSNHLGLTRQAESLNPDVSPNIQNTSLSVGPNPAGPSSTSQTDKQINYDVTRVWNNHVLRFGASFNRIETGGNAAYGSYAATVTGAATFANEQAILGNPNLYAAALIAADPAGQLDNPLNYPVASITIYNGQGFFAEKSGFGFSHGGLNDNRIQIYGGDIWKIKPNLTINYGLHYIRDGGLTNSDLPAIPSLNGFGPGLGNTVRQPNLDFSPQLGLAWAPFSGQRTVLRAGAGLYYDSNLFATALADRSIRLQQGQYYVQEPLCGPGEYSLLLPNGTSVTSSDGLNIATQICGHPLGSSVNGIRVSNAIADLQNAFQAASAVSGANGFYAGKTGATLGSMLSPNYESPRSLQINLGWEHQIGSNTSISLDYIRNVGTHYLLAVDRNHVGDASNLNVANAIAAINRTLAANAPSCGQVTASTSISGITCYLRTVHNASVADFAVNGLDSSGEFAHPAAAFSGDNTSLGQGIFYEPIGNSRYRAVTLSLHSVVQNPIRRIQSMNLQTSYAWSKFQSNVLNGNGTGPVGAVPNALDWDNPNGFFGPSGLSRTHQGSFGATLNLQREFQIGLVAHIASPLPITAFLPQLNGGGVAGEIFRSDATGDGTVGDIVPGSNIGSFGRGTSINNVNNLINSYNANDANHPTPAGNALISNALFTQNQLLQLGAVMPTLANAGSTATGPGWLKTVDLRLAWQHVFRERFTIEPSVAAFNIFNFANFDNSSNLLSGILAGVPGFSLNGSPTVGCGNFSCRSADRVGIGSGVFTQGSARQFEIGFRFTF